MLAETNADLKNQHLRPLDCNYNRDVFQVLNLASHEIEKKMAHDMLDYYYPVAGR